MDMLDEADKNQSLILELGIREARKTTSALKNKGACHYCDGPTNHLFCDKDCADDYEKFIRRRP